jgi:ribosomal protein S14
MSNVININREPSRAELIFVKSSDPCASCGRPGVLEESLCRFCLSSVATTRRLASKIIYTACYAKANFESFRARVWDMSGVVIDIRYSPTSSMVKWRKAEMRQALGKQYRHIIELGNESYNKRDLPIKIVNLNAGIDQVLMIEQPVVLSVGVRAFGTVIVGCCMKH